MLILNGTRHLSVSPTIELEASVRGFRRHNEVWRGDYNSRMEPPVPIGLVVRNGFYLAGRLRAVVIPAFRTYVDTVVPETLAAFGDIERRAEEVTEQAYQQSGTQAAGEDYGGDMGAEAEKAFDAGLAFYELMSDFRQAMSNLLAVGMYHLLEQQLADLTEDGLFRGLPSLQDGKLSIIRSWFQKNLGIDLTVYAHWQTIEEELRRVANTVKHADGGSAVALREKRRVCALNCVSATS